MKLYRHTFSSALALACLASFSSIAFSQTYPDRPIKLIIGLSAGQSGDVTTRLIAAKAQTILKQPIVVENRPGAAGILSHAVAKTAAPDGYTVLMTANVQTAILPVLNKSLPYDPVKDFEPVTTLIEAPLLMYTAANVPVRNVSEMLSYVKEHPGKVSYGSAGNGSSSHISMELLKRATGVEMLHVPYKGAPAVVTDVLGGQVAFAFDVAPAILPFAADGRVRLLGVSSAQRMASNPEIPTIAEQGVPGFEAVAWSALVVPKGTPEAIVNTLNAAFTTAIKDPDVRESLRRSGATPLGSSPEELRRYIAAEIKKWAPVVRDSGAQVN